MKTKYACFLGTLNVYHKPTEMSIEVCKCTQTLTATFSCLIFFTMSIEHDYNLKLYFTYVWLSLARKLKLNEQLFNYIEIV